MKHDADTHTIGSIRREIIQHPSNAWALTLGYNPVFTASESARIMIVGQAPGRKAQDSGIPWNDVSGDLLRTWLGLPREVFYDESLIALVPMDFYYPGKGVHGDKPPRKDFAPLWHPRLLAAMPNIKLILPVGRFAQLYYLQTACKPTLTETLKAFDEYLPKYLPLLHPSPLNIGWRKRNPWFEQHIVPRAKTIVHTILSS